MTDRRKRLLGGSISVLVGTITAIIIFRHPEQLDVPPWVAYAACAVFGFAGLAVIANEFNLRHIHVWLAIASIAVLLVPSGWIAFGPGVHQCVVSLPFFNALGSEFLCRSAFGLGAFIVGVFLIWATWRAVCQQKAG